MYDKQLFGFCDIWNNQGLGMCYQHSKSALLCCYLITSCFFCSVSHPLLPLCNSVVLLRCSDVLFCCCETPHSSSWTCEAGNIMLTDDRRLTTDDRRQSSVVGRQSTTILDIRTSAYLIKRFLFSCISLFFLLSYVSVLHSSNRPFPSCILPLSK